MSDSIDHSRRSFLGKSAAIGTITVAPGIFLHQIQDAKTICGLHLAADRLG